MPPSFVFVVLLAQVFKPVGALTCLSSCTITGLKGQRLNVRDSTCSSANGTACLAVVSFHYHTGEYRVMFNTAPMTGYSRSIYITPPNSLDYWTVHACSNNDTCALEFAQMKVSGLSRRDYNSSTLWAELVPILQESKAAGSVLSCFDNETCVDGTCNIGYDTKSNSQIGRQCHTYSSLPNIMVRENDFSGSFDLFCNRTRCNSPQTADRVKAILTKYKLTDANGRIPDLAEEIINGPIIVNGGHGTVASMLLISGLVFIHGFFSCNT